MQSCGASGAFGTLWVSDLSREPDVPGYDLLTTEDKDYGFNGFAMIALALLILCMLWSRRG